MSLDDELRDWAETRRGGDPTAADVQALLADAERPRERAPRTPWLLIGAGVSALALAAAVLMAVGVGARLAGSSLSPETHDPVPIAAPEPQRAVPEPVWTGHVAHDGDTFDIDGTLRPVADVPEDRYILDGTVAVEAAPRTHDRPLRIVTDRWEVTVIGTRFVVTSDPFAVEVTEGVVAVRGPDVEVSLRAGDAFRDGTVQRDEQRDREYTNRLGDALVDAWPRHADVLSTHLAARAAWRVYARREGTTDPFRLIQQTAGKRRLPRAEVEEELARELARVDEKVQAGELGTLLPGTAGDVLAEALDRFGRYHRSLALEAQGSELFIGDPTLCLYYQNRLSFLDRSEAP